MSNKTKGAPTADAKQARQRVTLHPGGIAIYFDSNRDPGALAFGNLKPGVEYVVAPDEALRLTSDKRPDSARFDFALEADARRADARIAELKAAAETAATEPAPAAPAAATDINPEK